MKQNKLFKATRWRLAIWYGGVMASILSLSGLAVYEAIAHAHRVTVERELKSVSATIHNSLESVLIKPGELDLKEVRFLPSLCLAVNSCASQDNQANYALANAIAQDDHYIGLFDTSGNPIAYAGKVPPQLPIKSRKLVDEKWQTLQDSQKQNYRQTSVLLHTKDNRIWGYLLVGRSLEDIENYLASIKLILSLGLPLTMLLVSAASWWLAKLAMQPIYQSYKQIQQFTADAAHELRTPLAAIRATVESTQRIPQLKEVETRETLQVIARQNSRLAQLVEGLLLLSHLDRQGLTSQSSVPTKIISLNDVVSDLIEELAPLGIIAEVQLSQEIRVSQVIRIRGNEEQLYRLVTNLVTNAINYTPAGGQVKVVLATAASESKAVIQVQDTGIGISPEQQVQVFKRFYRIDSDRSRQTGGFGLGLPIALALAQAHQGNIELQSFLGQGSTFTIYLPLL